MYQLTLNDDILLDYFAGGGGASQAIEAALGRPVDYAINHDPAAVAMHTLNHRSSTHFIQDVYEVNARKLAAGRRILHAHLSPDCKHFSKAKGAALRDRKIRDLAWVAHKLTSLPDNQKPFVITLENVEEFTTWGPLIDGVPDPKRKGQTFRAFINAFRRNGYEVEWKELRACDYGAGTIRKRLFLIARCDGKPIVWPAPTHADPKKIPKGSKLKPWVTAAECIDWSIPAPSIFDRKKPLAPNTLKRVAKGMKRFVIEAEKPFIVQCNHGGEGFRGSDIDAPLNTFCPRDAYGIVTPYLTEHANASNPRVFPPDEPLRTQCANVKGGHFALVAPSLIQMGYGERKGQQPRVLDLEKPLGTVTAGGNKFAVTSAYLAGVGGRVGQSRPRGIDEPLATMTTKANTAVVVPYIVKHFGGMVGTSIENPVPTTTTRGTQNQLASAYITKMRGTNTGHAADEPTHTVSAGGTHHAVTSAFLVKYYGNEKEGADIDAPLGTVTVKDRFGLIQVESAEHINLTPEQRTRARRVVTFLQEYSVIPIFEGYEPDFFMIGDFIVYDIGMRMLAPKELAQAQGFYPGYIINRGLFIQPDGSYIERELTKTEQVRMIGNSVSPPPLEAIMRENVLPLIMFQPPAYTGFSSGNQSRYSGAMI